MSVDIHIRHAMRRFRTQIALIDEHRRWTFGELEQIVERLSGALQNALEPGDRVCLFMKNRSEYIFLQLALERAGLVRVPLNTRYTAHEVERSLDDCEAAAIFCDASTVGKLDNVRSRTLWICPVDGDAVTGRSWSELMSYAGRPARSSYDFEALCSINYTSGSSGEPKGVMMSHRNWRSVYQNMLIDRSIESGAKLAHIGPLTHASGAYFTPFLLRGAASVIVANGPLDIFLSTIERKKITAFTCVPTVLTRILNHANLEDYDLSSLRWIGFGGEAIPHNTLKKALAKWGPILTQNYGLTEAMMTCSFMSGDEHLIAGTSDKPEIREGCIGRPYTFVDLVIRNQDGSKVDIGDVGEITISSEHVMQGYWRKPEETARVLRDGWLWSGDLARQDEEGYVYLVGRSKEMFISGGFNIYPAEVESCLSSCPGVQAAAVIGVPDESLGELCVAFIAVERGFDLTEAMCEHHCKPIIGFRTPKKWIFVNHLPLTGNGKVDKASLKASLEPQGAGQ